ncbi:MAG TPA: GGDEF domain-containing protein [Burkholderiaceae bacterium]|nr:GGDEF domain-containing protein [Burkholderiaceae bacterium]
MAQLIEHLADLTGFRDRDQLDVTIVRAIKDVLQPRSVAIYRCVGEPGAQRWLTRARIGPGDATATADPLGTEVSALPLLDDVPARRDSLTRAETITVGDGPQLCIFPISTEREVTGVLETETAAALTPADRAMVGTILRIYGNFQDLLDHSERDALTGLLNRQTFDAAFMGRARTRAASGAGAAPGRRAAEAESAVWLAVVDIDHFKGVNDTYGHLIGDEVLLLLSRLLRSTFRYHDRLYRFGGEEFVVVIACVAAEQAALAFERLRANVERFSFPQVNRITVSIGFTLATADETPSAAFARADKALYHAKNHGRNQVVHFDDLVRAGLVVEKKIVGDVELF